MVAAKKTVKKGVPRKASATKRPVAKESGAKEDWQTLRVGREVKPFFSFNITRQTVLWIILMIVIIVLQIVILVQMNNTSNIIDQVEQSLSY